MKILSISYKTLERYVKYRKDAFKAQQKQQIYDLWLACESQTQIEEITGIPQRTISDVLATFSENRQLSESAKFSDFSQESSTLRIYDIWNFNKATNEVRHFGNIPPEIIGNLLSWNLASLQAHGLTIFDRPGVCM